MTRILRACAVAVACILWIGTTVQAQTIPPFYDMCMAAGFPPTPPELKPDLEQCCSSMFDCWNAEGCTVASDSPRALSAECFGCNVNATACIGYAIRGSTPEWECPASCSYEGVHCGASDGCGGVCVSDALCPFYMLRPEFIPVLW